MEDTFDVGVDHRTAVVEREGGHRVGGVRPDTHQRLELLGVVREGAVVVVDDLAGGLVEVLRAVVVPQ